MMTDGGGTSRPVARRRADAWWLAARPTTLWAGLVPVLVGTAVAVALDGFRFLAAFAALFGALAIQVGTNFANDVFDFEKGADNERRFGPPRAVQSGLLTPREMKAGMLCAFSVAAVFGSLLVLEAGPVVILIGVVSIAAGIFYTAGPLPLAYVGLGDLFVFVFFGIVAVTGTVYVQTHDVPALAFWASLPIGAISTAILVVNNLRDCETDARAGKRTLAVRFGPSFARAEYVLLLASAYVVPLALRGFDLVSWFGLLPLGTLPLAFLAAKEVWKGDGVRLNGTLARTAQILLAYGSLFAIGVNL